MGLRLSDARELANGLERLTMWLRREAPAEVSASTISALTRLRAEGPLRVSDLAASEAMTQPGVTVLVNRLSDAGFAERLSDPTDRRATLVRITPAGDRVLSRREATRAEVLRERLAQLDDDDQRLLTAALPAIDRLTATTAGTATQPQRLPRGSNA